MSRIPLHFIRATNAALFTPHASLLADLGFLQFLDPFIIRIV